VAIRIALLITSIIANSAEIRSGQRPTFRHDAPEQPLYYPRFETRTQLAAGPL